MPDNTCVCCGRLIPEGSHICLACGDYGDMQTFQTSRRAEIVTNCDKLRAAMSPAAMAALLAEPEDEDEPTTTADKSEEVYDLKLTVTPIPRLPKLLVEFHVHVTPQDIDDIMVTALEGGITHWCGSAEVVGGKYLGEYASDQISRGGELQLCDIEDPSEHWILSRSNFLDGLAKYLEAGNLDCIEESNFSSSVYALETGDIDGDAADSIIQYALFGELVYG